MGTFRGIREVELARTIRNYHSLGWSCKRIGKELGKDYTAIAKWKKKMKLDPLPGSEIYKLTDKQLEEMKKLFHEEGYGAKRLGKHFNIGSSTAYRYMLALGLRRPPGRNPMLNNSDKEDLIHLWGTRSLERLAKYFGVQKHTVIRWAKHLGLPDAS